MECKDIKTIMQQIKDERFHQFWGHDNTFNKKTEAFLLDFKTLFHSYRLQSP